jgi:hypothetical protein
MSQTGGRAEPVSGTSVEASRNGGRQTRGQLADLSNFTMGLYWTFSRSFVENRQVSLASKRDQRVEASSN